MYSTAKTKAKHEGQEGSLEEKRGRVDSSRRVKKERHVKSGQKCWLYRKQQKKICKCNWKTKGSLPKKIMESHLSNVMLGSLLQLISFTHRERGNTFSMPRSNLRLLTVTMEGMEERCTQYKTILHSPGLPSAFSFGFFDYGEVEKSTLSTQ